MWSDSFLCGLSALSVACLLCLWSVCFICGLSALFVVCLHCLCSVCFVCGLSVLYIVCMICLWSVCFVCGLTALFVVSLLCLWSVCVVCGLFASHVVCFVCFVCDVSVLCVVCHFCLWSLCFVCGLSAVWDAQANLINWIIGWLLLIVDAHQVVGIRMRTTAHLQYKPECHQQEAGSKTTGGEDSCNVRSVQMYSKGPRTEPCDRPKGVAMVFQI